MSDEVTITFTYEEFYAIMDALDMPWLEGEEQDLLRASNNSLARAGDKIMSADSSIMARRRGYSA